MLLRLQNIDSHKLICKIFQNKELEAGNPSKSDLRREENNTFLVTI